MTPPNSEPLTAEEIAWYRAEAEQGQYTTTWTTHNIKRLLATLDAARDRPGLDDVQRYSEDIDEDGHGYMELDPAGRWVLFDEVRLAEAQQREGAGS